MLAVVLPIRHVLGHAGGAHVGGRRWLPYRLHSTYLAVLAARMSAEDMTRRG